MPAYSPIVPDISRRDWTVEERNALPDDGHRYEVVDGELLVTPAPSWRHQDAELELAVLLKSYAERHGLHCLIAPADVTFSPRRVVEPDVFVVPTVEGRPPARFEERWRPGADEPEILAESLSWQAREGAEPLVVDLARFFRRVYGE